MGRSLASGHYTGKTHAGCQTTDEEPSHSSLYRLLSTRVSLLLRATSCSNNMPITRCGNGNWRRQRPQCPSRAQTSCEAPVRQLVLLDTRAAPVLIFDRPKEHKEKRRSRFLSLPFDVLEHILSYLLVAPGEIYLGIVALEHQWPHHWHPAYSLRRQEPRDNRHMEDGLGRHPVDRHRRAQAPYGLCSNLMLVNRRLHVFAARMLYGRNAFAVDISVPNTQEAAQHHDISRLRLEQIIPLNLVYQKLLRQVNFRHYNNLMHTYPVRFFHSAMIHLLKDIPGAFTAFRRRYNTEYNLFDFETFAGWSPSATPTWLADAAASLATSQPLTTTNMVIEIDEVHRLMSTLWEEPANSYYPALTKHEQTSLVDLSVTSNATVSTKPWDLYEPQTWRTAITFLARLRNDKSEHHWPDERTCPWYECKAYSRLQTSIVGKSRGYQQATVHESQRRRSCSPVWRDGPKGKKRRVFTAPMSFFVPRVCLFLRAEQLKLEDQQWRREGDVNDVLVLPVDSEGHEKPWHIRTPIEIWPLQYEYV